MAKIILNVELKDKTASGLKDIENNISQIGKSFSKTTPKLDTAQLEKSVNNLRKGYANLLNTIQGTEKYYKKGTFSNIAKDAEKYLNQLKGLDKTSAEYQKNVQNLQVKLGELQANFAETRKGATNFHGSLQEIVGGFLKFQVAAMLVMKPLQMVRQAWASLNETLVKTEDAVIAIQRVLNDDSLSDSTISGKLYDLAQRYGQTFENVNDIAQNFARTGMSWNETIQATESALLALNVAELDATQASDGMIAIMQQFGKEASELTGIIDMLNKTADNYAVTTDKLLTALQRTGSSASNANLSLAETVGLITALSEATGRSGENLGTAINSLIQYSSKDTALDTFASLDQNTADIVDKYRKGGATILDVWMAVSGVINNMDSRQEGILAGLGNSADITDLNQELQDELGDIFEQVSDVYGTANTFRKNYFIALLGNMQTVQDAIETASDASGYSQKENEKYLDTYTAKVNSLNAQWEYLVNNEQGFLGVKKELVEIGSGVLTVLEYTGGLRTVGIGLATGLIALFPAIRAGLTAISTKITQITGQVVSLNSKAGIIGLIATAASMVIGGIDKAISASNEATQKKQEELAEANKKAIDSSLEAVNHYKELANTSKNYADKVTELREVLDDETSSEEAKVTAQEELLSIQTDLINSNNAYADSLDLVNGNISEQLGLIEKLSEEQLKQQAQNYLEENRAGITTARNQLADTTTHSTDYIFEGNANKRFKFRDILNKAISGAGVDASILEDNTYGYWHNTWKDITEGFSEGIGNGLLSLLTASFSMESADWVGEAKAGLSFSGPIEQQIKDIKALKDYVNVNHESLGITLEEANMFSSELSNLISKLDTEEYKNAVKLDETAKLYEDFLNGVITKAEFLKEVYGIELIEIGETWEEQSSKIITNYQELLDVVNGIRNAEQNILDIEEKKKALEDARNNKTVRVYNASTGQWELVADAKAIANAEKAYEEAVWKNLQTEIKDGNINVKGILDKISDFPKLTSAVVGWLSEQGYDVPDNLMYGSSTTIESPTSGMSSNVSHSTNDNRVYSINGVTLTKEQAENHSVAELFEMIPTLAED